MRALLIVLSLVSAKCAYRAETGSSVLPVYVIDDEVRAKPFRRPGERPTARYHACTGAYVASDLVATSTAALPRPSGENSFVNVGNVKILDGDRQVEVTDVAYFDHDTGLALVRVAENRPVFELRSRASSDDRLYSVSHAFRAVVPGRLAKAESRVVDIKLTDGTAEDFAGNPMYRAETASAESMCGAPVFDLGGSLVGIVHGGHGTTVYVVTAETIAKALAETRR